MASQLQLVEETGVPGENHRLTTSHWHLFHMPRVGFEPRQWWETASSQWQSLRPHSHQGIIMEWELPIGILAHSSNVNTFWKPLVSNRYHLISQGIFWCYIRMSGLIKCFCKWFLVNSSFLKCQLVQLVTWCEVWMDSEVSLRWDLKSSDLQWQEIKISPRPQVISWIDEFDRISHLVKILKVVNVFKQTHTRCEKTYFIDCTKKSGRATLKKLKYLSIGPGKGFVTFRIFSQYNMIWILTSLMIWYPSHKFMLHRWDVNFKQFNCK